MERSLGKQAGELDWEMGLLLSCQAAGKQGVLARKRWDCCLAEPWGAQAEEEHSELINIGGWKNLSLKEKKISATEGKCLGRWEQSKPPT